MGKRLSDWETRKGRREIYFAAFPLPKVHILLLWSDFLRVIGVAAITGFGVCGLFFVRWMICRCCCWGLSGYRAPEKFCPIRGEFGCRSGV
jgi:hypothetical protein